MDMPEAARRCVLTEGDSVQMRKVWVCKRLQLAIVCVFHKA